MGSNANAAVVAPDNQELDSGQGRSTIKFPYQDLDDAIDVAKGVHAVGGTSCQKDQLAAHLNMASTGGGFALRLITARMFGLIVTDKGSVNLTPLGQRICDSQQEKAARAEAFLNVPLYIKIYEQFKGTILPPSAGLETAMEGLGVAPKQKDKARQVFQRSATQAGFFAYGANRLVMPSVKSSSESKDSEDAQCGAADERKTGGSADEPRYERHPLIEGLIKTLPKAETEWTIAARRKWLQAASNIFDLIYTDCDNDKGSLTITISNDSAK